MLEIERHSYSHPWSEAVFNDCFQSTYRLWALCRSEEMVGYAVVAYMVDEAHLLNVCVTPEERRLGAGKLLLRHSMSQAAADGMVRLLLEVRAGNEPALKLYEAMGFAPVGRRRGYYPAAGEREDACVLSIALPPP